MPESPENPRVRSEASAAGGYAPPRLVRYGSIVDLTGTKQAGMGVFDGGVVATMGKLNFLKSG